MPYRPSGALAADHGPLWSVSGRAYGRQMNARDLAWGVTPVLAAAALGTTAAQGVRSPWYRSLRKPRIQPPPAAFPIVWTTLYADVAAAASAVQVRLPEAERRRFRSALVLNMGLNAGWCLAFFRARRLGLSVGVAAALAASSWDLTRRARRASGVAAAGLGAYASWCSFATVLSAAVRRANPHR